MAVALSCALFLCYKAGFLLYPDLAVTYPFLSHDSFQWIADGLYYSGSNLEPSYRNPGLPLFVALLSKLGVLRALPIVHTALLGIFFIYLTRLLLIFYSLETVALTVLFLFFNVKIQTFFDLVLADPWAVTLQLISLYYLFKSEQNIKCLIFAYVAAGLSFICQYALIFIAPMYLVHAYYLLAMQRDARRRLVTYCCFAVMLAFLIVAPNFVYKAIKFGNPFHSKVTHFGLVQPHFYSVFYYLFGFFGFFGIPAATAIIVGFFSALHEKGRISFFYIQAYCYIGFWIFLYVWHDVRFILYLVPCCAFFLAYCIDKFKIYEWYEWRDASLQKKILSFVTLPLLLSFGFNYQGSPLASNILPISPQSELVLSNEPITSWNGNVTVNLANMHIRYHTKLTDMPGFSFFAYYWFMHKNINTAALEEYRELSGIHEQATAAYGKNYRVKRGGMLSTDYMSEMKLKITLQREVELAESDAPLVLTRTEDATIGAVLYTGPHYRLSRL